MSLSVRVATPDPSRSPVLRAALAVPLLYTLFHVWPRHWSWAFPSDQATGFYAVNGLLFFIPIAVWCTALALLALGSPNRIAWALVAVGGTLVAVYGFRFVLAVQRDLNPVLCLRPLRRAPGSVAARPAPQA